MPHSLKSKVKSLCYKGEITEQERDRIIKALEQTELNPSYNGVKSELKPCEEENPNCTECRYYDKEKHHCPRFCRVIENTMAEITSEQPRWIPCSERLPENQDCYLVTTKWKGSYSGNVYIETNMAVYREKPKEWDCVDVIAWMPLPQPYAESEDKE